jgi:sortase A
MGGGERLAKEIKTKKKHTATVFLFLIMSVLGSGIMLYPSISDYINSRSQTKAIAAYHTEVSNTTAEMIQQAFEQAERFNDELRSTNSKFSNLEIMKDEYYSTLRLSVSDVMAYIEIPKMDVNLPVFHGTGKSTLQVGIGHLEGTSLPIGGINNHAALSGHRGLPSAKLFTHLDRLEIGDIFIIHVLGKSLYYQVDKISVVLPEQLDVLSIVPDKDLVTLITCTPYAVNTHRLLVRGTRIEDMDVQDIASENFIWHRKALKFPWQSIAMVVITALALAVKIILRLRRKKA